MANYKGADNVTLVLISSMFSGTVFLWLFWPSFNAALAPGDDQHRAILNTYFCLAACAVTAFAVSAAVHDEDKFDMVRRVLAKPFGCRTAVLKYNLGIRNC